MQILKRDNIFTGLWVGISSIILVSLLVYLTLYFLHMPVVGNVRFFLFSFIPIALFMRYYMRTLSYNTTGKTLLVILIVVMIPLVFYLIKSHEIIW